MDDLVLETYLLSFKVKVSTLCSYKFWANIVKIEWDHLEMILSTENTSNRTMAASQPASQCEVTLALCQFHYQNARFYENAQMSWSINRSKISA